MPSDFQHGKPTRTYHHQPITSISDVVFLMLLAMPIRKQVIRSTSMDRASPIGGTSAVAPLWAGLIALLNQKRGKAVGYLNPFLHQNYQQLAQNKALRDVTSGNNGSYTANPGWDAYAGLGTPDGTQLLQALTSSPTQA